MDSTAAKPKQQTTSTVTRTHHKAWIVIVVSFVIYLLMCAAFTFGIYSFLFLSNVSMDTTVRVARGSIGVIRVDLSESFELAERVLSRGDTIITDSQSQSVVSFRDSKLDGLLVSAVTVKNDSTVIIRQITQPRFDWSGQAYQLSITGERGEIDVHVPGNLGRRVDIEILLPDELVAHITHTGIYTLSFSESEVNVQVHTGIAELIQHNSDFVQSAVGGQSITYIINDQTMTVARGFENLLDNNLFITSPVPAFHDAQQDVSLPVLDAWNCGDRTTDGFDSVTQTAFLDGHLSVNLMRGRDTVTHGETVCIQPFGPSGQVGRKVDMYNQLEIRTTFYIESHSLDTCGIQGSECPLMLLMDYVDIDGDSNQWFQGFYSATTSSSENPVSCVSCQQEHKRINDRVWYTYESGNLFNLLPDDRRPASILNMRFYASGHDYNVYVSEMSILGYPPSDIDS